MGIQKETWLPFHPNESYTRKYNEHFHSIVSDHISGRILDLGAKQSSEEEYRKISNKVDKYISVDISKSSSLNVLGDGRKLPFKKDTFDTVIISAVIEHVPIQNLPELLAEAKRILDPDGAVIAYIPFVYPLHEIPHDFSRPTYYGLESLFSNSGFTTSIYVGGGLGETLLHTIYKPFLIATDSLNIEGFRWSFLILHLIIEFASNISGWLIKLNDSEELLKKWYIGQLVVGTVD